MGGETMSAYFSYVLRGGPGERFHFIEVGKKKKPVGGKKKRGKNAPLKEDGGKS